jgi:hypothetical protein
MGNSPSELWDFAIAVKNHAWGGGIVTITLAVLVCVVSVLKPHEADGNATAALLRGFLLDIITWIRDHRFALTSNSILIGIIYCAFWAYVDVDEKLKNPITISFEYGNEAPFLQLDSDGKLWIRIRANNNSTRNVDCIAYLNSLEKSDETKPLWAVGNPLILQWRGGEFEPPENSERIIPPKLGKVFNIGYIAKEANVLSLQNTQYYLESSAKLSPGIYKFAVQLNNLTCQSDPTVFSVKYDGGQQVSFMKDQGSGR